MSDLDRWLAHEAAARQKAAVQDMQDVLDGLERLLSPEGFSEGEEDGTLGA